MAKKRRLNKGQQRRVKLNQRKRLEQPDVDWDNDQLGPSQEGRVISRYGQHADIMDNSGDVVRCHIRRAVDSLVCGDRVQWRRATSSTDGMQGVVEAVHDRDSLLSRPDFYDGLKPVAANIDQILVISSVLPAFSSQIIDRYLVACEDIGIEPILVLNKTDLLATLDSELQQEIETCLSYYASMGYQVLRVSSATTDGLSELIAQLPGHTSIVVGQSGVGKSSLVNNILPDVDTITNDVSDNSGLGQHTTTVATWYELPEGGALIDSPGIREFSLWHLEKERVAWGFKDFRDVLGGCKFRDCKHQNDPGCALQEAVEAGKIASWRLQNYHRIIESMNSQKPNRAMQRG
ncbi:ribosome biogenesis GTPase RsgA [Idiomarina sp. OT37-5b]|uniref:Small ribosomal subunit biogenesis GTPase RsgA n=1 Tax=Idiomarina aquatica TaxID=1327752 RepID=A0AA94EDH4_9GAMM|nr:MULTISPECIES: small ribosomal subunit biogenesis GTPase RsgA [Idiomarina]AVJ56940.1 ribosome biogenesis GTPase RsgA [Idiomarina sp. OT37-5b]RUO40189.1 ribosome biogenesis GTPase RsgA [Idiomarina aquatica]